MLGVIELDWENFKQAPVYETNFEAMHSDEVNIGTTQKCGILEWF